MTALLVSVRSAEEAEAALAGGAAVIDIKEPDRGALGAADPQTWRAVLSAVGGRAPVSAALGELFRNGCGTAPAAALAVETTGLAFAKIGLAGAANCRDWQQQWHAVLNRLPQSVAPVAVAYADWPAAETPRPEEVIDAGAELGCTLLLVDTFGKTRGNLLSHLPLPALEDVTRRARRRGMQVVLAGSLTKRLVRDVLPLSPALVAVRGAACKSDRRSAIDAALVRELAAILAASPATATTGCWGA
jgi:(5-formylfuran-3-yl)methyl phosphate synthase